MRLLLVTEKTCWSINAHQLVSIFSLYIKIKQYFQKNICDLVSRALSLGIQVTASDNFRAGFKTLSFSQPVYFLFAADEGTNPETAGRTAIENIYVFQKTNLRNV